MAPTDAELTDAIATATRSAVADLFAEHPDHHFYYLTLITTGEGHAPALAAWSRELLAEATGGDPEVEEYTKWSYADSPLYPYRYDEYFGDVRRLFQQRPDLYGLDDAAADAEWEARLGAMEAAVARLDADGVFGPAGRRAGLVLAVEVMPPDEANTARVRRLNPPEVLETWLAEAAE